MDRRSDSGNDEVPVFRNWRTNRLLVLQEDYAAALKNKNPAEHGLLKKWLAAIEAELERRKSWY